MFGTLKGFSKFLFDSPTKDNDSNEENDHHFKILPLKKEKVSDICLAEKSFVVYTENTHKLFIVNENFQPICILQREIKQL